MGNIPDTEKQVPLTKVLQKWKRILVQQIIKKKYTDILYREHWPFITRDGTLVEQWPPQGTFDQHRLTFLQHRLRIGSQDKWITGTFGMVGHGRKNTQVRCEMKEASPKVTFEVAEPTGPDKPQIIALLAAGLYPMLSSVLPNPAAMKQRAVVGAPPVLQIFTKPPWNPGDLAQCGK